MMPQPMKSNVVRRLPADYTAVEDGTEDDDPGLSGLGLTGLGAATDQLYRRHEGGLLSRVLGVAVHTLLQEVARLRLTLEWEATRLALAKMGPRIASPCARGWH